MHRDGYAFMLDGATKFYNTLRIAGWFHHPEDELAAVALSGQPVLAQVAEVGLEHGGVASLGPRKGFVLQVLRAQEVMAEGLELSFTTRAGWQARVPLAELVADALAQERRPALEARFAQALAAIPGARVLDLGGRDRSGADHSRPFGGAAATVCDVLAGENVDVVADAHRLAERLPAGSFDAVFSDSVFEHLVMPWAVVGQINHVLKPGGLALVFTHQSLGMHDMPWDFWRISDTAWDGLFNRHTGFEIVERLLERPMHLLPHLTTHLHLWAERAAGFERSAVLARKIGPCAMAWPLGADDVLATQYPPGVEDPTTLKS